MSTTSDAKALMRSISGQVFMKGRDITIIKRGVGHPVTITLHPDARDSYELKFPSYLFLSRISHFSPVEDEYRFCRNKTVLMQVIKDLKRAKVWDKISNKQFLKVNDLNKKSPKRDLESTLEDLLESKSKKGRGRTKKAKAYA